MPLRIARHFGWLLRHHSRNDSMAPCMADTPRPATIQISTSPPPPVKVSPPVEAPQRQT